jgi:hypothetical protein
VKDTKIGKNQNLVTDISVLVLTLILAVVLTLILPINLFLSTLLFFGPPALYFSWRRKDVVARTLIYATTITIISILTDYLAERDNSWVSTSMFDFRLAGVVPIEALVWMFLFTYLIVVFYLYYFDRASHAVIGKRMPLVFFTAFGILVWFSFMAVTDIHFTVSYFYIKFGLLSLVPLLLAFTLYFPQYLKVFLQITPYFFVLGLLNLLISLEKGYWSYPGQNFIGWVQLGPYRFPWEELVFWIILFPSFLVSQFEFFNNDHLKLKRVTGKTPR